MDNARKSSSRFANRKYPASEYSDRILGLNRVEDRNLENRLKLIDKEGRSSINMINREIRKLESELDLKRELIKTLSYEERLKYLDANLSLALFNEKLKRSSNLELDRINLADDEIEKLAKKNNTNTINKLDINNKNYLATNVRHSSNSNRSSSARLSISLQRASSALPNLTQNSEKHIEKHSDKHSDKLSIQNLNLKSSNKSLIVDKKIEHSKEANSLRFFDQSKSSSLNDTSSMHPSQIQWNTAGASNPIDNSQEQGSLKTSKKLRILSKSPIVVSERKFKKLNKKVKHIDYLNQKPEWFNDEISNLAILPPSTQSFIPHITINV